MYDDKTKSIVIEGNEGYKKAQNFMKMLMPSHVKKIKKYRGKIPLFIEEGIEQKLNQIFDTEIKFIPFSNKSDFAFSIFIILFPKLEPIPKKTFLA